MDATTWLDEPAARWVRTEIPFGVRIRWFHDALSWPGDDGVRNAILALTLLGCLALRAWWNAALALAAGSAGTALTFAVKEWMERPRPSGPSESFAYPSGHAALAALAYGLALFLLWDAWRVRHPRTGPTARFEQATRWSAGLLVVAVGLARILGGVHWPTDVLGGWALGGFVVAGTLWVHGAVPRWWKAARGRWSVGSS